MKRKVKRFLATKALLSLIIFLFLYQLFLFTSNGQTDLFSTVIGKIKSFFKGNQQNQLEQIQKESKYDVQTPKPNLCPPCNFTPLYPPTSSRRDVVLAASLNSIEKAEIFVRTLRMTGSLCRIILFIDKNQKLSPHNFHFFSSCQVELVMVNNSNNSILISGSKMTRYYYYHQWLSKHIKEVDRVLHSDTFDVFFQSDPFSNEMLPMTEEEEINEKENLHLSIKINRQHKTFLSQKVDRKIERKNILYVSVEPVSLGSSIYTGIWFSKCYGASYFGQYNNYPVSCSGVTMGYSKTFLNYLNIMFEKANWRQCFGDSLDQAHHNFVLYHNDIQNAGIEVRPLDCNSEILTMHFCCKYAKCHLNNITNIFYGNNSNKAPIIVHQYNRLQYMVDRNHFFCPGNSKSLFSNVGNLSELNEIEILPEIQFPLPDKLS